MIDYVKANYGLSSNSFKAAISSYDLLEDAEFQKQLEKVVQRFVKSSKQWTRQQSQTKSLSFWSISFRPRSWIIVKKYMGVIEIDKCFNSIKSFYDEFMTPDS